MLRPIALDLLDVAWPLGAVGIAVILGLQSRRLPGSLFRAAIASSVIVVLVLGGSYFVPFPEPVYDLLWMVGGEAIFACVAAAYLLGVVASERGRSTSNGFLTTMIVLTALIIVLNTGGRLWWRLVNQSAWENAPDADGRLTQSTGWTCSPATAAMLLHRHGIATSEGEMAYLANTSYLGTDVRSIAQALTLKGRSRGLVARVAMADLDSCRHQSAPFLACIWVPGLGSHAVLALSVHPDRIDWIDPRFGQRQSLPRAEVEPIWEGRIVFLDEE